MKIPFYRKKHSRVFLLLEIQVLSVRLHRIDTTREPAGITLLAERSLPPGDVAVLVEKIRDILPADSDVRDMAIVMNSPAIRHQAVSIPPMSLAERQKVLMRETKQPFGSTHAPGAISFWSAGKTKHEDVTREHVLCAELPRTTADDLIAAVRERNFNLIGFTSHAQMVSHLLKECSPDSKANVALLEVNEHEGSVTLFHSNIWNMDRQFLIGTGNVSELEDTTELDAEKLRLEVGRALQYFKQQVRNENIGKIYLYGAPRRLEAIRSFLESSFRIPVTPMVLAGTKPGNGEAQESTALFDIPHAAALYDQFENYIDFLPAEWRQATQIKARQVVLAGSAVALYALLAGVFYLYQRESVEIDRIQSSHAETRQLPPEVLDKMHLIQASRSFALATEQSARWSLGRHRVVATLIRELASAVPPEMKISALEVTEKGNSWQVNFQAQIHTSNGSNSQRVFLKFQEQMRRLAFLKRLSWKEVQLSDAEPADDTDSDFVEQNMLTFTMAGIVPVSPESDAS
jgi:hypothetical protein